MTHGVMFYSVLGDEGYEKAFNSDNGEFHDWCMLLMLCNITRILQRVLILFKHQYLVQCQIL